jgi:hypothetical protein
MGMVCWDNAGPGSGKPGLWLGLPLGSGGPLGPLGVVMTMHCHRWRYRLGVMAHWQSQPCMSVVRRNDLEECQNHGEPACHHP